MSSTLPVPPQNKVAEEELLSALMLSSDVVFDRVTTTGLQPSDFSHTSHGAIYMACLTLHRAGHAHDVTSVVAELERHGGIPAISDWRDRVLDIARLAYEASTAPTKASIVIEKARLRRFTNGIADLVTRANQGEDPDVIQAEAQAVLEQMGSRATVAEPLTGLTHDEVLELSLDADRELVDGLIPAGAVGTIAGVPETHKSWVAQAVAVRVARGSGWVLGREVVTQGPVGYFWQDDSTREEAERVKLFEQAHTNPSNLPLRWFLNEGVELPRDLGRIRATVLELGLVLIILDSYYNFLPGIDLKDEQAEQIVSALKRDICDDTGCTVLTVDHMPWATDTNRARLRAYGGVFKNAATRFGIYIDAVGDKLHIEARGNNIKGFAKRLAYWDADALELKLVTEGQTIDDDAETSAAQIAAWVIAEGGDVEAAHARAHFDISDDTLRRRIARLTELGIDYIGVRGKASRLVARETWADPAADQLELDAPPSAPHMPQDDPAASIPHNQAAETLRTAPPATEDVRHVESGDLQDKQQAAPPAPPTGEEDRLRHPSPQNGSDRLEDVRAWIRETGWNDEDLETTLILQHHVSSHDLPGLLQLAAEIFSSEVG